MRPLTIALLLGLILTACSQPGAAPAPPAALPTEQAAASTPALPTAAPPARPEEPTAAPPTTGPTAASPTPAFGSPEWYNAIQISGPICLTESLLPEHEVRGVVATGEHLYALHRTGDGGLQISRAPLGRPGELAALDGPALPPESRLAVRGDLVLVGAVGELGLYQAGADALAPLGRLAVTGSVVGIALADELAYLALAAGDKNTTGALLAVDLRDPAAPAVVGRLDLGRSDVSGVAVAGPLAAVVDGAGLTVVAIDDPSTPRQLGAAPLEQAGAVALRGELAAVATANGIRLFDLADPAAPALVGSGSSVGFPATSLALRDKTAYITYADIGSSGAGAFERVSIADPANPITEAFVTSQRSAWQAAPLGDNVAVAFGLRGLPVLRAGGCR